MPTGVQAHGCWERLGNTLVLLVFPPLPPPLLLLRFVVLCLLLLLQAVLLLLKLLLCSGPTQRIPNGHTTLCRFHLVRSGGAGVICGRCGLVGSGNVAGGQRARADAVGADVVVAKSAARHVCACRLHCIAHVAAKTMVRSHAIGKGVTSGASLLL